jgi:hypothetical protein
MVVIAGKIRLFSVMDQDNASLEVSIGQQGYMDSTLVTG